MADGAVAGDAGSAAGEAGRATGEPVTRLLQLRRRHPWTQQELAAVAGVSVGTVRCIEQGVYRTVQPRVVRALAAALGVAPAAVAEFRATLGLPPVGAGAPLDGAADGVAPSRPEGLLGSPRPATGGPT